MASKRRLRRKACDGKIAHASKEAAHGHRVALAKSKGDTGLGVYKCKHCKKWHIGHGRGSRYRLPSDAAAILYHD